MLRNINKKNKTNKRAFYYFLRKYGLSTSSAEYFCALGGLNRASKGVMLTPGILRMVQKERMGNFYDEIELQKVLKLNLSSKVSIRCYQGVRLLQGLPVRGQRTKTNRYTAKKMNAGKLK